MATQVSVVKDFTHMPIGTKLVLAMEFEQDVPKAYTLTVVTGLNLHHSDARYSANRAVGRAEPNCAGYNRLHNQFAHQVRAWL